MRDTDNNANIIDIRDLIARIEELEEQQEGSEGDESKFCTIEREELQALVSFVGEMKSYGGDHQWRGDWYPVTLIRHDHFQDYAEALADDIGAIKADAGWPLMYIDWEAAADALKIDYGTADFDGVEYYYR